MATIWEGICPGIYAVPSLEFSYDSGDLQAGPAWSLATFPGMPAQLSYNRRRERLLHSHDQLQFPGSSGVGSKGADRSPGLKTPPVGAAHAGQSGAPPAKPRRNGARELLSLPCRVRYSTTSRTTVGIPSRLRPRCCSSASPTPKSLRPQDARRLLEAPAAASFFMSSFSRTADLLCWKEQRKSEQSATATTGGCMARPSPAPAAFARQPSPRSLPKRRRGKPRGGGAALQRGAARQRRRGKGRRRPRGISAATEGGAGGKGRRGRLRRHRRPSRGCGAGGRGARTSRPSVLHCSIPRQSGWCRG